MTRLFLQLSGSQNEGRLTLPTRICTRACCQSTWGEQALIGNGQGKVKCCCWGWHYSCESGWHLFTKFWCGACECLQFLGGAHTPLGVKTQHVSGAESVAGLCSILCRSERHMPLSSGHIALNAGSSKATPYYQAA